MKKAREFLAFFLAAALFVSISYFAGGILMPHRVDYGSTWHSYLKEDKDTIDVLVFGSSIAYCDVVPAVIWKNTGVTAYVMSGPEQTLPMSNFLSHSTGAPSTISQWAAVEALNGPQEGIEEMRRAFEARRDYMYQRMNAIPGVSCIKPEGAFYVMMNIEKLIGRTVSGTVVNNADDFAMVFYGWGEPVYILLMLFSIGINYAAGLLVGKYRGCARKKARTALGVNIAANLALLIFFKYFDLLAETLSLIPGVAIPKLGLGLPIGISFYTFQAMGDDIVLLGRDKVDGGGDGPGLGIADQQQADAKQDQQSGALGTETDGKGHHRGKHDDERRFKVAAGRNVRNGGHNKIITRRRGSQNQQQHGRGAESPHHLRQHPASVRRPGCERRHPLPAGA